MSNEMKNNGTTEMKEAKSKINIVALDDLRDFDKHPFAAYSEGRQTEMVRSIEENGILSPIIVRPHKEEDGKYEILSGHNRVGAARKTDLTEVPVIIKDKLIDDDEAMIFVIECNLSQKSFSEFLPSEKRAILSAYYDSIKKKGKRSDLVDDMEENGEKHLNSETSRQIGGKSKGKKHNSDEKTAEKFGVSARDVSRYIRLNSLGEPLMARLDNKEFAMGCAVDISFLSEDRQQDLDELLNEEKKSSDGKLLGKKYNLDIEISQKLKKLFENSEATKEDMRKILDGKRNTKIPSVTTGGNRLANTGNDDNPQPSNNKAGGGFSDKDEVARDINKLTLALFAHFEKFGNDNPFKDDSISDNLQKLYDVMGKYYKEKELKIPTSEETPAA